MKLVVRRGYEADIEAAVGVYARSNLARRRGAWPNREARLAEVEAVLRDRDTSLLVGEIDEKCVAMAASQPLRADDASGGPIEGAYFLNLLFVVPELWGQGIGGATLDAMLEELRRRGCHEVRLWTDDGDQRSKRLYRGRGLKPTGRTRGTVEGSRIGEWLLDDETSTTWPEK